MAGDLLRDSYGPWPSDVEPMTCHEVDPETLRKAAGNGFLLPEQPPSPTLRDFYQRGRAAKTRPFSITIADAKGEVRLMIDAATLADALEKAAAAIRR